MFSTSESLGLLGAGGSEDAVVGDGESGSCTWQIHHSDGCESRDIINDEHTSIVFPFDCPHSIGQNMVS